MTNEHANETSGAAVTADFIRHRNVLLLQADMGPLFVDYYLHLADQGIRHTPAQDAQLKQALTAFTLHAAARPRNEHLSWTIGLQNPPLNLFMAGDNEDCTVTGRLFTENVREAPARTSSTARSCPAAAPRSVAAWSTSTAPTCSRPRRFSTPAANSARRVSSTSATTRPRCCSPIPTSTRRGWAR